MGGLTVWRELTHANIPLVYFGDTLNAPYGDKTPEQLVGYFWTIMDFFTKKGCMVVVAACNTSSAVVLPMVGNIGIPLLGIIEPAIQATLAVTKGRIGVLATERTIASGIYQTLFKAASPGYEIFVQSAPQLAYLVDNGIITGRLVENAVRDYIAPLLDQQIDTLLLGCTHYPFLGGAIERIVGVGIEIVDPAPYLATKVKRAVLGSVSQKGPDSLHHEFWVSADPDRFRNIAQTLLKTQLPETHLYVKA